MRLPEFSIDKLARMLKGEIPMDDAFISQAMTIAAESDSLIGELMREHRWTDVADVSLLRHRIIELICGCTTNKAELIAKLPRARD
ncbi:MAG: hypothetical protein JOY54_09610 [Acidobacteriaceae bacterium]|nr:hypothetical protein [Acidobacteriaceae bacterium]